MFSPRDGYAADGSYRVQIELTPYAWGTEQTTRTLLPATRSIDMVTYGPYSALGSGSKRPGPSGSGAGLRVLVRGRCAPLKRVRFP